MTIIEVNCVEPHSVKGVKYEKSQPGEQRHRCQFSDCGTMFQFAHCYKSLHSSRGQLEKTVIL
ncbi:Uncharacterised protein [Legionella sainthelensi]|nr:Uncharacterised protein [Legionella sainthelensi]